MSATNPEQSDGFDEFLGLVRALPPDRLAAFNQFLASVHSGTPVREAATTYFVAIGTPEHAIERVLQH